MAKKDYSQVDTMRLMYLIGRKKRRLNDYVTQYGLNHKETIRVSRELDDMVVEIQRRRNNAT